MEQEILNALKDTNESLQRLTLLVLIGVIAWIIRSVVVIINHGTSILKRNWRDKAQSLFEEGKHEKLQTKAKQMIAAFPNSAEGHFWLARAERGLGLNSNLKKTINRLLEIAPDWKEDWMGQFLDESPKPSTSPEG